MACLNAHSRGWARLAPVGLAPDRPPWSSPSPTQLWASGDLVLRQRAWLWLTLSLWSDRVYNVQGPKDVRWHRENHICSFASGSLLRDKLPPLPPMPVLDTGPRAAAQVRGLSGEVSTQQGRVEVSWRGACWENLTSLSLCSSSGRWPSRGWASVPGEIFKRLI